MLLLMLIVLSFQAKAANPDFIEGPRNTYWITCGDSPKPTSRQAESPKLIAPRTQRVAFAKARAETGAEHWCRNTSELYIQEPGTAEFRLAWRLAGEGEFEGNGIKIVDWSPDGRYLLFELAQWPYTHGWQNSAMVYDAESMAVRTLETNSLFRREPEDCFRSISVLGFTAASHAIVRTRSAVDYEHGTDEVVNAACPKYTRMWQIPLAGIKTQPRRVSRGIRPSKYARIQK